MKAYIDIENSRTKEVKTLQLSVLTYVEDNYIVLSMDDINESDYKLLIDAIDPKLSYTDIEMFFIDDDPLPNFGPDYTYALEDDKIIMKRKPKNKVKTAECKNEDWTVNFEDKFEKIAIKFLASKSTYLLIYYDFGIKYEFLNDAPDNDIFMKLFFDKGYNSAALFKKEPGVISDYIRDKVIYINSYVEDESLLSK